MFNVPGEGQNEHSGELIKTAEFTGVLFPASKKAFLNTVEPKLAEYAESWNPSRENVLNAENAAALYLHQHAPEISKKLSQYTRQYAGIAIHRNKMIYMNFFCNAMNQAWMSTEVDVEDGGDCHFQVNYSVSYGKVVDFMVNGRA